MTKLQQLQDTAVLNVPGRGSIALRPGCSPCACRSASFRCSAMPLVVSPIVRSPGRACSCSVSGTMSGLSVGSPPVRRILSTPACTNSQACSAARKVSMAALDQSSLAACNTHDAVCRHSRGGAPSGGSTAQPGRMPTQTRRRAPGFRPKGKSSICSAHGKADAG